MGVTIALGFTSALAVIAGAVVLAGIVNRVFLDGVGPWDLSGTLVVLALIYVARGVFEWARSVAAHRSAADVKRTLRDQLMRAMLAQTARGRSAGSGDLALIASSGIDALASLGWRRKVSGVVRILFHATDLVAPGATAFLCVLGTEQRGARCRTRQPGAGWGAREPVCQNFV